MTPPVWTNGDEALWHAYATAALAGRMACPVSDGTPDPTVAAAQADAMLAEHRRRFPREVSAPAPDDDWSDDFDAPEAVLVLWSSLFKVEMAMGLSLAGRAR